MSSLMPRQSRERGSSSESWKKAGEALEAGRQREAARMSTLRAHIKTLPAEVSGMVINPDTGEITDNVGNYVFTVSIGDTVEDVRAEIEAWFEYC